tara:strand:- start:4445 stop:5035 length:591 start_codon:yes stop_codon:yes gene_type:complete
MFLKKIKFIYFIIFFVFIFNIAESNEKNRVKLIKNYLNDLRYFSASFIQNDNHTLSEGKIFIGKSRIRVEYNSPTKILIILDEDKAMYYNYDLDEDEFFNPKDTSAWFFYDIFNNPDFFDNAQLTKINNNVVVEKIGNFEMGSFQIEVFFENNPFILRMVKLKLDQEYLELSFFDHNYNQTFNESFFKLINPSFFD